jgi:chromosome segregation ATPase
MSFIKSIVKEIKTVKSMLDIPELKNERSNLSKKLESHNSIVDKHQKIIQKKEDIEKTVRDLEEVVEICLKEKEDEFNSAKKVIEAILNCVEDSEKKIKSETEEISRLEQELKRVNDKLSAARASVR